MAGKQVQICFLEGNPYNNNETFGKQMVEASDETTAKVFKAAEKILERAERKHKDLTLVATFCGDVVMSKTDRIRLLDFVTMNEDVKRIASTSADKDFIVAVTNGGSVVTIQLVGANILKELEQSNSPVEVVPDLSQMLSVLKEKSSPKKRKLT